MLVRDALLGLAVGDALGVPVEFSSRERIKQNPVSDMRAFGTHHQPAGTWSDDSSLAFCLVESLCNGYNLQDLAFRFVNWKEQGYWTPHGKVFDIGLATSVAIDNLRHGVLPTLAGGADEQSNGNGSLMRILPLLFHIQNLPIEERFQKTKEVSSLTHRHIRSVVACFIYLEIAWELMQKEDKMIAFEKAIARAKAFLETNGICSERELYNFHRILMLHDPLFKTKPIFEYTEAEISSSGYVLHTLEAAIWCLLSTNSYSEAVLKAVNLGSDTDTTGAVTGGLAGLYYGASSIPQDWLNTLVKYREIEDLAARLQKVHNS